MSTAVSVQRTPELIAAEINSIKSQTRTMVLYNSIEIGRRLTEVKLLVPHGEWGKWLESTVEYSKSTANNLMRIFEEYGANQLSLFGDNAKFQALGNLSYTQAVALLGVPEEDREQFIKEHDIENMSTRELQLAIKERDQALKQLEDTQRVASEKSEEARRLLEDKQAMESFAKLTEHALGNAQEDVKTLKNELKREQNNSKKKISELQTSLAEIKTKLTEAQAAGNDEEVGRLAESLEKTDNELAKAHAKIEELERQLKEKPIEVTATVEKIPDEVQQELDELRKRAAQQGNPAAIKFKICFDKLVDNFKDLLGTLAEIPEDETDRYKKAVLGLIGKMSERL